MTTIAANTGAPTLGRSANWIIDKRNDLLWFIGGALAGYAMFFLHAGMHLDMITVWFIWVVFIDSPHFFGTYVRTYFDKEEFQARRKLLLWSLLWLGVGPAVVGVAYLLYQAGVASYQLPFLLFVIFFNLWAYWHVVRQHWGILALYRRKNNDIAAWDTRIDRTLLYVGLLAPFVAFLVRHPEARGAMGLDANLAPMPVGDVAGPWRWEHFVVLATILALGASVATFVGRQVYLWSRGLPVNRPKLLFITALIPLYSVICYSPAVLSAPLLAFGAFVTVYHDVQYHAIVYFYAKNRYHKPGVDRKRFGLAPYLTRNVFVYLFAGICMAGAFRLLGCSFEVHPGCSTVVLTSSQTLFGSISTKELLIGILLGFPLHHYFVDQFIWRPSKDAKLRQDLKV